MAWALDGYEIEPAADVSLSHDTLTVSFLASARGGDGYGADPYGTAYGGTTPLDVARGYDRSGDLDVQTGYAGRFRAVERSGRTDVETTVDPATRHAPPVDLEEWYVVEYGETQVAPELYRVELGFRRPEPRADAFDPTAPDSATGWGDGGWGDGGWGGLTTSPDTWTFDLAHGALELDETQVGLLDREGSSEGAAATLELVLDREQAAAIADSAGYVAAAVERSVPGGLDFGADTHPEGRQTVYASMHEDFELADGWYVVRSWELELFVVGDDATEDRWRAVLDVLPAEE